MISKKLIAYILALLCFMSLPIHAMEWVCDEQTVLSDDDIKELYVTGLFLYDAKWVTGCTYKPYTIEFNNVFTYYTRTDINAIVVNIKPAHINATYLKLVYSESEMYQCIINHSPAVGYMYYVTIGTKRCNDAISKPKKTK